MNLITILKTKYLIISFLLISFIPSIHSCSKLSDNGDLDGKWQLLEMYSKTTESAANYTEFENKADKRIYWMFQMELLNIRSWTRLENVLGEDIMARFAHNGNEMRVGPTYVHFRERDSLLTDPSTTLLEPVGIRGNAANFQIKVLNSKSMILCSEKDSLIFKKK